MIDNREVQVPADRHRAVSQAPPLPPQASASLLSLSSHPALLPPSQREPLRDPCRPPDFRSPPPPPPLLPDSGFSREYRSPGHRRHRQPARPLPVLDQAPPSLCTAGSPLAVSSRASAPAACLPACLALFTPPPDKVGAGRWGRSSLLNLCVGLQ